MIKKSKYRNDVKKVRNKFEKELLKYGWVYGVERHFQQYFSYIVAVSFIGEGNQSTRRKLLT
jgi:hypothetical protein